MSVASVNIVLFILYKNGSYELVNAQNFEDIAEFMIEFFDDIKQVFEIDVY